MLDSSHVIQAKLKYVSKDPPKDILQVLIFFGKMALVKLATNIYKSMMKERFKFFYYLFRAASMLVTDIDDKNISANFSIMVTRLALTVAPGCPSISIRIVLPKIWHQHYVAMFRLVYIDNGAKC